MCIVLVDLKKTMTETVQDPPIRRPQKYTSGLDGLFSFLHHHLLVLPLLQHPEPLCTKGEMKREVFGTAQNFIQVPPPVDVELHATK